MKDDLPLGWWVVDGAVLLGMLREVADGDSPEAVYAENYPGGVRAEVVEPSGDAYRFEIATADDGEPMIVVAPLSEGDDE